LTRRLHLFQRLLVDPGEVTEVEAKPPGRDQRSGLFHMGPEDFSQGCVEQMGRRVIERCRQSFFLVDLRLHVSSLNEGPLLHDALMNKETVAELEGVRHLHAHPVTGQPATVSHLAAGFAVKGSSVKNDFNPVTGLG
jgi:hypothetical protein